MKKLSLLLLFVFAYIMPIGAEKISEQEALATAQAFFVHTTGHKLSPNNVSASESLQLAHTSTGYYVFNRGVADGFVIVAADDKFSKDILGYADQGTFDIDNMPDNMRWWLGGYDRMLESVQKVGDNSLSKVIKVESSQVVRANIDPLVTSKWNQNSPYNDMCPTYNGIRCPSGCLATALAQIVYFNEYPQQGVGSHSYEWFVDRVSQGILSVDFSQHTYNYDAMLDTYDESSSAESRQAVAQLMSDIGILSNMGYKPAISGAQSLHALQGLIENLKYDKGAMLLSREFYTDEEWIDMVYNNLASGYPLYYSGLNQWAGHAFVCDGYRDGYFHINWGWGGSSDGYFLLDALDPGSQGIGGSSDGYNDGQEAIFNLKRPQSDSKYVIFMCNYNHFGIEQANLTNTSTATFTGAFNHLGLVTQTIVLGVKVVDSEGNATWIQTPTPATLNSYAAVDEIVINMSEFPTADGEYRVYPAYQDENGIWKEMRTKKTFPESYLIAKVSGKNISFSNQLIFSNWTPSEVIAEKEFTMKVDIENVTGAVYYDNIKLALMEYGTSNILGYSDAVDVSIAIDSTSSVTFTMTAPAQHGFCNYFVVNSNGMTISEVLRLAVEENTETTEEFTLTLNSLEVANADNVSLDNINITAQITCESGRYNGFVGFFVYPETGGFHIDYLVQDFYIRSGETLTVDKPSGDFYGLQTGKTYYVSIRYDDPRTGSWALLGTSSQNKYFTISDPSSIDEIISDDASVATSVYNLLGIRLLHFEAGETIDTTSLSPGVYIVKTGDKSRRIVVND